MLSLPRHSVPSWCVLNLQREMHGLFISLIDILLVYNGHTAKMHGKPWISFIRFSIFYNIFLIKKEKPSVHCLDWDIFMCVCISVQFINALKFW